MRRSVTLATGLLLLSTVPAAFAADHDKPEWYDRVSMKGDFRGRVEHFDWENKYDDGLRTRFRYRFRLGLTAKLSESTKVGFQLRSGNPSNPHSDNQSLDGGFNKDTIAIAQSYFDWQVREFLGIRGGKFSPKKLWHVSDLQWDDDVIAEGLMQTLEIDGSGILKAVEANAYQFVLEESSSSKDAYLVGVQVRPILKVNDTNQVTAGVGYDTVTQPDKVVGLTLGGKLVTEPEGVVTNLIGSDGKLVSDFNVFSAFVEWKNKAIKRWPVKVSGFYYKNVGAEDAVGAITDEDDNVVVGDLNSKDNDTAYYARVQVGDYKRPGQVAVRVTKYKSEPDAMYYAWVQSDTKRGTNVDGQRVDLRIGMPQKAHINVTFYNTDWEHGSDTTMNRWQFDYIFPF